MKQLASKQRVSLRPRSWQGGSVAVESALVLPVLLAAVAATIVIGLRLSDQLYLTQAARELGVVLSRVPYMAALKASGGEDTYTISQFGSYDSPEAYLATLNAGASNCGPSTLNYSSCTTAARGVTQWYAQQLLFLKRMFVSDSLMLRVSYVPPAADVTASNGLCMIKVDMTATSSGLLSWAAGSIAVSQSVPYVSSPVPNVGCSCRPSC